MFQTLQALISWLRNIIYIEKQIFYIDESLLERLTFSAQNCLSSSFGRGYVLARGIGCQFHGYFVHYTNLSFKEMSQIERRAYNRQHNMCSRMLMHTIHSVGIISPALQYSMHSMHMWHIHPISNLCTHIYTNSAMCYLLFCYSSFCLCNINYSLPLAAHKYHPRRLI